MLKRMHKRIKLSEGVLEIAHFSGHDAFAQVETAWKTLFRQTGCKNLFLHFDWMRIWWECHSDTLKLDLYLIRYNNTVVGLAPLMRRPQQLGRITYYDLFMLTAYEDPFSERAVSGSLDFLWLWEYEHLKALFARYLLEKTAGWCYLRLNPLPEQSTTLAAFRQAAAELSTGIRTPWVLRNAVLNVSGDWDNYYAGLSAKFRKNIRRFLRSIEQDHQVEFCEYRSIAEVEEGLAEMLQVEQASWKDERGFQIDHASMRQFYLKITRFFADRGQVRLWMLKMNHQPVAYDLHLECDGYIKTLKGSYAAAVADYSPGTLLTCMATQKFFKDDVTQVDLLWGSLHYKQKWTNALEQQHGIYLRRRGWFPYAIRSIYRSNSLRRLAGASLKDDRSAMAEPGIADGTAPEENAGINNPGQE